MKRIVLYAALFLVSVPAFSQHNLIDSLRNALTNAKTDTGKAIILYNLSSAYQVFKPDSALLLAERAYSLSVKHNFLKGQSWSLNQMAGAFNRLGDYPKALEYFIKQLKITERGAYPEDMAIVNMDIALVYISEKDIKHALYYSLKADSIIHKNKLTDLYAYSLLNLGDISEKADKLPEALTYTQQCYALAVKNSNSIIIGTALNNLGNIYAKMNDGKQAILNYKASLPYLEAMDDNRTISECMLGLANESNKKQDKDSAFYFAGKAYTISSQNGFLDHALDASVLLSQLYKKENKLDSALAYNETILVLKDSIDSREKVQHLESLTIQEELRQQQLAEQVEADKADRREKLQLLAIGIMIPIFFLFSIYISRKKVHSKIIEFSGIVSLLLLFEYITLLIHPFVAEKTNNSPFIEIIIFVGIAALITPTHHRIERLLMKHLAYLHEKHTHATPLPAKEKSEDGGEEITTKN